MAHERLRFNIVLNEKKDKKNNKTNNTSFDPIYSDIKYNTHFSVFANFTGKKVEGGFKVGKINFHLQNYTGEVTIGLKKVVGILTDDVIDEGNEYFVDGFSTGRNIKIFLLLQGLSSETDKTYNDSFILKEGDIIEVVSIVEPIDNSISKINEPADVRNNTCLFADYEYMFRDGEEIVILEKKKKIDAILSKIDSGNYNDLELNEAGEIIINTQSHGAGRRCKMKISDVYIK